MRYAHISLFKRREKSCVHLGGVEKFGAYLQRAIPSMTLYSWEDYATHVDVPDYEKAKMLNAWLLREGLVGNDTVVVCDGYWGMGLEGKVARLISVVHGSYLGRLIQSQIYPWNEIVSKEDTEAQLMFWDDLRVELVAVSKDTRHELYDTDRDDITVIPHGVDLTVYKPMHLDRDINMFAGTSARKGYDIIVAMQNQDVEIEHMDEKSGSMEREAKRLNRARVLIAPTRHEGNSYLLLESIACGTPLLTYDVGYASQMDERCGIITDDLSAANFLRLFDRVDWSQFNPREYAEQFCSFEQFEREWRNYLEVTD